MDNAEVIVRLKAAMACFERGYDLIKDIPLKLKEPPDNTSGQPKCHCTDMERDMIYGEYCHICGGLTFPLTDEVSDGKN